MAKTPRGCTEDHLTYHFRVTEPADAPMTLAKRESLLFRAIDLPANHVSRTFSRVTRSESDGIHELASQRGNARAARPSACRKHLIIAVRAIRIIWVMRVLSSMLI